MIRALKGKGTRNQLGADFWKYFSGQLISQLGSSFSQFALPLLIFKLTGSAVNLGISMAVGMLPYLLFGLVIGAWVDRLNRKRLMVIVNILLGLAVGSVPLVAATGHLTVGWIYGAEFVASTMAIFFNSADFAALPSLVGKDNLVTANGRIQASYSAAGIAGPILAGFMIAVVPLQTIFLVDAASYAVAAGTLLLVRGSFNGDRGKVAASIRADVVEGLKYVIRHPVLRNISIMMALVNFVSSTIFAQTVLFAKVRLDASNTEIGWLFAAGGVGVVVLSLLAGPLRKRWSFSQVALGALALQGVAITALAFTTWVSLALPLMAISGGLGILFNINTTSLRQSIVPNEMLGRVMSIAAVLAWSAIPLGSLLGGYAVESTGNVVMVFAVIGVMTFAIPVLFAFTALGHADRYITPPDSVEPDVQGGTEAERGEVELVPA